MIEDRPTLSRREFARRSAAATIGALIASGCREVGSRGTTIRFWNGFTGPDGTAMLKIIKKFNALHDDVQVTMQRIAWDTYYNKVFVAGLGGRAPETFVVQVDHLERFIWGKLVAPVNSMLGPGGIDLGEFDENVLASARRGSVQYAIPLDVHPMGVFYNKKLFAEAGIAHPPTNRDEFVDALKRLKSGSGSDTHWGFVYEWLRVNLYTLLRQWDARIVGDDLRTCELDSPQAAQALDFGAQLINEGLASPIQNTSAIIGFRQGRVGMVFCGIFILHDVQTQTDLDWAPATIPQLGPKLATWAGSHMMCIREGLDERTRAASEKWIRYLSDHSLDWAAAGQVPVRKPLRESDTFKAMTAQSTFAQQIPYVQYMPSTTFTREYQIAFDTACESVLRGTLPAEKALAIAAADIRNAAARFAAPAAGGGVT